MSISPRLLIGGAAAFLFCATSASLHGQLASTPAPGTKSTPSATAFGSTGSKPAGLPQADAKFIKDASESILFEQKLADLGGKTATAEPVKKSADTINTDLKKIWTDLATLSSAKNSKLAMEAKKPEVAKAEALGKLKADKFDKEWVKETAKETKKTAHVFETAEKAVTDPEVKKFLSDWLPTVRGHDTELLKVEKDLATKKK